MTKAPAKTQKGRTRANIVFYVAGPGTPIQRIAVLLFATGTIRTIATTMWVFGSCETINPLALLSFLFFIFKAAQQPLFLFLSLCVFRRSRKIFFEK
jgi:hypothetical protein